LNEAVFAEFFAGREPEFQPEERKLLRELPPPELPGKAGVEDRQ
jgi:hypothetical protein